MTENANDRIFAAAELLYKKNGETSFPTVDAVRKEARVNMNDASAGMRLWRQEKTKEMRKSVEVPDVIKEIGIKSIAKIWQKTNELAYEALNAAQTTWDAERLELEALRLEMSEAFESKVSELNELNDKFHTMQKDLRNAEDAQKEIKADAARRVELAEQKVTIVDDRADELRNELEHAKNEINQLRCEREEAQVQASKAIKESSLLKGRLEAYEKMHNA